MKLLRKVQDVAHGRRAEAIDRLGVVAHHREAPALGLERLQNRCLKRVGVLILVDEHEIEPAGDIGRELRNAHQALPKEQKIVVVEHGLVALRLAIGLEEGLQRVPPFEAPGKLAPQHLVERLTRVDRERVDGKTRALARKAPIALGKVELVTDQIDEIGGIAAIQHGEAGWQADLLRIVTQKAASHSVEGAGPAEALGQPGLARRHLAADPLDPADHLLGGAPAEGQEKRAPRIGACQQQMRHAMRERHRLARAGPGHDQQRRGRYERRTLTHASPLHAKGHGGVLAVVQRVERRVEQRIVGHPCGS